MKKTCLVAALLAPLGSVHLASAQTNPMCNDTAMFPNPIYMAGSSAIVPMLSKVAVKLAGQATIIYKSSASCDGPNAINNDADLTGTASYYVVDPADATKVLTNKVCDLAPGTKASVGVSDVSFKTCIGSEPPATIGDFQAMVQSMLLVVPETNTTLTAMSAEQARAVWGCGMKGAIAPFVDELAIQQRNDTSGTQKMVATYIGVPSNAMKGKMNAGTGDLVTSLLAVADFNKAIGFVAADAYETRRSMLNAVAFRGFEQTKAYYPDSNATATDKRNVRDGHYMIQGPLHLITKVAAGVPSDANAKKAIDWLQGTVPFEAGNPKSYIDVVAKTGNVPQCAMKVKRADDGALLEPYTPAAPCGCYFEAVATGVAAPAGCTACTDDTTCGGKKCNYGFCE
jgi:ABC-type phosphate transport system substrate-binding protein